MNTNRIIGWYKGMQPGPLVVCIGGIHGNEPAGVQALEALMRRLDTALEKNPDFEFRGTLLALCGNLAALSVKKRFLNEDLNRAWTPNRIAKISASPKHQRSVEEQEIADIIEYVTSAIASYKPTQLIVIDLHTSSADGGIFSLPGPDRISMAIAEQLHAPAVHGLLHTIEGAALAYFLNANFGLPVSGLAFEAGQHQDPESPRRALAAVINCLHAIGCVQAQDLDNEYDTLLKAFSRKLPANLEIIWRQHIEPTDKFRMEPGFRNFDPVRRGQILAYDLKGAITASADARILMPLYQPQGEDGFFLVREKT